MRLDPPTSIHARSMGAPIQRKSRLSTWFALNAARLFCSIGVWNTNSVPITNNVIYNTYESALVVSAQNNIVQKNLISTIYWSGKAQPQFAEFNTNNDGAITSLKATSVVMRVRFVFERLLKIAELFPIG